MSRQKSAIQKQSETHRRVFIICEGLTEKLYLENFGRIGCADRIDITFPYRKRTFDLSQTDRMQLVRMMEGEMTLRTIGRFTPYMFVTKYLHNHLDGELESEPDTAILLRAINDVRDKVLKMIGSEHIDENGFVKDPDTIAEIIRTSIEKDIHLSRYSRLFDTDIRDFMNPLPETSISDMDLYYMVFDRDWNVYEPQYNTESQYREVFEECDRLGYKVLMSTPLFEFWLLMHHEDASIEGYGCDLGQKMTILEELKRLEGDYCDDWKEGLEKVKGISDCRMDTFYNLEGFKTAVKRSKTLETDREGLLNTAGSNIGVELESLLS